MKHLITPHARQLGPYYWWEGAFSEEELNSLQDYAQNAKSRGLVGGGKEDANIRKSNLYWMDKTPDTSFAFERLAEVVAKVNLHYAFDLTGFAEHFQLTNYDGEEQGMYGWHQDFGNGPNRKLSLILQLTDPAEYEGGNLEILTRGSPLTIKKQRGLITLFPSYTLHQVTPVTRGTRQTLVTWITGPSFR